MKIWRITETFLPLIKLFILLILPCLMIIKFSFALLIAILSFPYHFFKSSRFIKLNYVLVRMRQSTQETLDLHFLILDVLDISQQLQELVCILFHGLLPQSQLMKFFDLVIIVPVREVFLLEILLQLSPTNFPFINLLHLSEVLPPYGCSSSQIEDG